MKKVIFVALLSLLSQSSAIAQAVMLVPPERRAAKQTSWMKENLELRPEQTPKVEEINLRYSNKAQEIFNTQQSKQEKKTAIKTLYDKKDLELKGIFTEKQYSGYKMKENHIREKYDMK